MRRHDEIALRQLNLKLLAVSVRIVDTMDRLTNPSIYPASLLR